MERREASVPRQGTRRASPARKSRPARATTEQVRLSALRPPLFRDGCEQTKTNPGAKTRRGNEEDCAVWHREFEECTASGVAPQCVQPTPAAGGGLAARVPSAAPSHAYWRRRRLSINARALYFSCYLQVRLAGLHPSRAPPAQLYTRCRRTACRLRARVGVGACGHRSLRSRSARRKPVSCPGRA